MDSDTIHKRTRAPALRWLQPRRPPRLGVNDVHVWRVHVPSIDWLVPAMQRVLNAEEQARTNAFRCAPDRQQFIVGRGALRLILSGYLDARASDLTFVSGPHGKPALAEPFSGAQLEFNLSHSADWVICAIARGRPVGVDVERRREVPHQTAIAARLFSAAEQAELRGAATHRRAALFFNIWTRKEARVKASGQGLFAAAQAEAEPERGMAPVPQRAMAQSSTGCCSLRRLAVAADYSAALAVAGPPSGLKSYELGKALLTRQLCVEYKRAAMSVRTIPCILPFPFIANPQLS